MKRFVGVLFSLGVLAMSLVCVPQLLQAADLTEAQQAALTAALAEKKSYAEIIKEAVKAGMDGEEVVAFLCKKAGDSELVYQIVYAAITNGIGAEQAVSGALKAGASLQVVVQAAKAGGASRGEITSAAAKNGFSPAQIGNAYAGIGGSGTTGGGSGGGSQLGTGLGGGSGSGGSFGGGPSGGAGGGTASPYKP